MLLLIVNLVKSQIWKFRNTSKHEKKKFDINVLSQSVVNLLKYRCAADFLRLTRKDFKLVWCKNDIFAQMTFDNFVFLLP